MTPRPKLVSAMVNLGLSLTVFAVLFGLLEIFIRATQPVAAAYEYAQCCDYALRPDQDFRFAKAEFDTQVRINALGMRGPVPDLDKPNRLLILGDSFAFGYGVNDDQSFPALVAERLGPELARSTAIINTGHSGYDTRREAAYLAAHGSEFRPTVVLVAFVLNDVLSNSGKFWFNAVPDGWLRYFPLQASANFLSYLVRNPEELLFKMGLNDDFQYHDAINCLRKSGCDEDWRVTGGLLGEISAQARRLGARVVFVHVPAREEIVPQTDLMPYDPARAEEMLREFARNNGAAFVALRDYLGAEDYYRVDGHWKPSGHEVAAQRIAAEFRRLGWLSPDRGLSPGPADPPGKD